MLLAGRTSTSDYGKITPPYGFRVGVVDSAPDEGDLPYGFRGGVWVPVEDPLSHPSRRRSPPRTYGSPFESPKAVELGTLSGAPRIRPPRTMPTAKETTATRIIGHRLANHPGTLIVTSFDSVSELATAPAKVGTLISFSHEGHCRLEPSISGSASRRASQCGHGNTVEDFSLMMGPLLRLSFPR